MYKWHEYGNEESAGMAWLPGAAIGANANEYHRRANKDDV